MLPCATHDSDGAQISAAAGHSHYGRQAEDSLTEAIKVIQFLKSNYDLLSSFLNVFF